MHTRRKIDAIRRPVHRLNPICVTYAGKRKNKQKKSVRLGIKRRATSVATGARTLECQLQTAAVNVPDADKHVTRRRGNATRVRCPRHAVDPFIVVSKDLGFTRREDTQKGASQRCYELCGFEGKYTRYLSLFGKPNQKCSPGTDRPSLHSRRGRCSRQILKQHIFHWG
jgi:hypothetical protein